jgi:ubiquinone/menaquinone biosynthesis C-methylase UbiE
LVQNRTFSKEDWLRRAREHFKHVAAAYDAGRTFEQGQFWAGELNDRVPLGSQDRLLDMGCGTGLFAVPFARILPCEIVGIDRSSQMLAAGMAKEHGHKVTWTQGMAEELPFPDRSFRAIFLSQVWHHLADERAATYEFFRVLSGGSGLFIKTFSHEQIRGRWDLNYIFPELMDFMLTIYADLPDFETLLKQAGFHSVHFSSFRKEGSMKPSELHGIASQRLWSQFSFISEAGYQAGLHDLEERIEQGDAPFPWDEIHLLVTALKN